MYFDKSKVSKTALTKMCSLLINESHHSKLKKIALSDLKLIEDKIHSEFEIDISNKDSVLERLQVILEGDQENDLKVTKYLVNLLKESIEVRSALFEIPPKKYMENSCPTTAIEFLKWFADAHFRSTFFEVNVHASLTESEIVEVFCEVRNVANIIGTTDATVVVFLDEVNTSSIIGLFKGMCLYLSTNSNF